MTAHLVLCGQHATGKSSIGMWLANDVSRPFVDTDTLLHRACRRDPAEYADAAGFDALAELAVQVLVEVLQHADPLVIAAASPVIEQCDPDQIRHAGPHTDRRPWVIYLEADPGLLAERIASGPPRPGLTGDDPGGVLRHQADRFAPTWRTLADLRLTVDHGTPAELSAVIANEWAAHARPAQHGHVVRPAEHVSRRPFA